MTKYEIEYPDAPSGNVTFYNYKEPLMKFDRGHGYIGALVFDTETDKVQCHLCGEWFVQLAHHLKREHNMSASAYKEEVGLFQTTALIGEKFREKLIASGLDKRLQNLRQAHLERKKNGFKKSEATILKTRETVKRNAEKAEWKNLRGTCPEQLLDRLQKIYQREGDNFALREHVGFQDLLKKTYGTVKEACRLAGVPYRIPGTTKPKPHKYNDEQVIDFVKEFASRFNRIPFRKDFIEQDKEALWDAICTSRGNKGKRNKVKHKYQNLCSRAIAQLEEYKHTGERLHYTKEELLGFLRKFEKNNGRKPSYSDSKRKLLPTLQMYHYHFGSWGNALKLAFHE